MDSNESVVISFNGAAYSVHPDVGKEIERLRAAKDGLLDAINDALLFDAWDEGHAKDRLQSAVERWSPECNDE